MTSATPSLVRDATPGDAAACAAVYAPYVTGSVATFETEPPDASAFAERIAAAQARHAWFVAERAGEVVGYAYAGPFRTRPAYDWSCETTVYLDRGAVGAGIGRALMSALLERLRRRGLLRAVAVITVPNAASTGLHTALGYREAARLERIGWKHDAWHDVAWLQLDLADSDAAPASLR